MKISKVLIAEDFESITISVRKTLNELEIPPKYFAYYCDDAMLQLRKALTEEPFQLLITDLSFEEDEQRPQRLKSGEELIKAARALQPGLKIIVFSGTARSYEIAQLYDRLGIDAYVPKGRKDAQKLHQAIEAIQKGKRYYDPDIRETVRQRNGHDFTAYDLTVLQQILSGKTQREVSEYLQEHQILPVSLRSIEQRLKVIRDSYGFTNNAQLIAYCKEQGII